MQKYALIINIWCTMTVHTHIYATSRLCIFFRIFWSFSLGIYFITLYFMDIQWISFPDKYTYKHTYTSFLTICKKALLPAAVPAGAPPTAGGSGPAEALYEDNCGNPLACFESGAQVRACASSEHFFLVQVTLQRVPLFGN